jgi:hypothetical protein
MKDNKQLEIILESMIEDESYYVLLNEGVMDSIKRFFTTDTKNQELKSEKTMFNQLFNKLKNKIKNADDVAEYFNDLTKDLRNKEGKKLKFVPDAINSMKNSLKNEDDNTQLLTIFKVIQTIFTKYGIEDGRGNIIKVEPKQVQGEGVMLSPTFYVKRVLSSAARATLKIKMVITLAILCGLSALFADKEVIQSFTDKLTGSQKDLPAINVDKFTEIATQMDAEKTAKEGELDTVDGVSALKITNELLDKKIEALEKADPNNPTIESLKKVAEGNTSAIKELQKGVQAEIDSLAMSSTILNSVIDFAKLDQEEYLNKIRQGTLNNLKSKNVEPLSNAHDANIDKITVALKLEKGTIDPLKSDSDYVELNNQTVRKKAINDITISNINLLSFIKLLKGLKDTDVKLPGFDDTTLLKCGIIGIVDAEFNPIDCTNYKVKDGDELVEVNPEKVTKISFNGNRVNQKYNETLKDIVDKIPEFDSLVSEATNLINKKDKDGNSIEVTDDQIAAYKAKIKDIGKKYKLKDLAKVQNIIYLNAVINKIKQIENIYKQAQQFRAEADLVSHFKNTASSFLQVKDGKLVFNALEAVKKVKESKVGDFNEDQVKKAMKEAIKDPEVLKPYTKGGGFFSEKKSVGPEEVNFESNSRKWDSLFSVIEENYFKS